MASQNSPKIEELEALLDEINPASAGTHVVAPPPRPSSALHDLLQRHAAESDGSAVTEKPRIRVKVPSRRAVPPGNTDTDELLARAMKAYERFPGAGIYCTPDKYLSGAVTYKGKWFIKLANGTGTLAVYAVRNDGRLERCDDYPAAIDKRGAA